MATDNTPLDVRDGRRLPFCQVDNALIREPGLDPYAKLVYVLLCGYMNFRTLDCFPTLETIGSDLAISKPTVIKALRTLTERAILETEKRRDKKGRVISNVYTIKDWRSEPAHSVSQVNDVDSDVCVKVNDVYTDGKPRLLGSRSVQVNDVDTNDNQGSNKIQINDNQVSSLAKPQEKPSQGASSEDVNSKKTKGTKPKKEPKEPDYRMRAVTDGIEAAYGDSYSNWPRHVRDIQALLRLNEPQEIVGCWKDIYLEDGSSEFLPLWRLHNRIKAWKDNGGKLAQKGNGNATTGRSHPQTMGNSTNGATSKAGSATSGHLGQTEGEDSEERMLANRWKTA